MNAIRTVSETDDIRTIEGLLSFSGQDKGRDSYGTRFSARTDWGLDLHPDGIPVLMEHGFDPDFGLGPVGRTSPTSSFRTDADGVWVQMQLDKRHRYYETRIKPLLDEGALGISQGSAEHSVRIARDGEVLAWPLHEVSLTPTNSNWFNTIAARTEGFVRIVASRATNAEGKAEGPPEGGKARDEIPAEDFAGPDKSFPIVDQGSVDSAAHLIGKAANPDAVKAKVIAIAKRKGLKIPEAWETGADTDKDADDSARSAYRGAAGDVACAAGIQASIAALMGCEDDEPDQLAELRAAFDAVGRFIVAESAEIGTPEDEDEPGPYAELAYMSALRAGRRNSASDQQHVDAIHDHAAALGASAHAGNEPPDDESHEAPDADDAARSAEALPTIRIVERPDADALRADLLRIASATGTEVATRRMAGG